MRRPVRSVPRLERLAERIAPATFHAVNDACAGSLCVALTPLLDPDGCGPRPNASRKKVGNSESQYLTRAG
jgi:hypothetical protein